MRPRMAFFCSTARWYDYFLNDFPAFLSAIATACFWGRPDFINSRTLVETTTLLLPLRNGIVNFLLALDTRHEFRLAHVLEKFAVEI